VQSGIERTVLDLEQILGAALDVFGYLMAVSRSN